MNAQRGQQLSEHVEVPVLSPHGEIVGERGRGNRTSDRQLTDIADSENRVVVTKDRDFRDSHLAQSQVLAGPSSV